MVLVVLPPGAVTTGRPPGRVGRVTPGPGLTVGLTPAKMGMRSTAPRLAPGAAVLSSKVQAQLPLLQAPLPTWGGWGWGG